MRSPRRASTARRQSGAGDSGDLDSRRLIIDALRRLSAQERAAIRRSHYSGWTTAQIAADLQMADSDVKETLHHALRAFASEVSRASRQQHV